MIFTVWKTKDQFYKILLMAQKSNGHGVSMSRNNFQPCWKVRIINMNREALLDLVLTCCVETK